MIVTGLCPFMVTPSPVPLPLGGEGERVKRGASPLLDTPLKVGRNPRMLYSSAQTRVLKFETLYEQGVEGDLCYPTIGT